MKITKQQPSVDQVLIANLKPGTVFRFKSKNTFEQDIVEENLYVKISKSFDDLSNNNSLSELSKEKFSFVRLGNKFELLHRQGPFVGSVIEVKNVTISDDFIVADLGECTYGDIVSFPDYNDEKYLVIYDPVDDKGLVTLITLDKTLSATSELLKMDKGVPCIKRSGKIII